MTEKFGTIPYQHAEWLSKNRMADPVTGADSDGYLLGALTGGFHANFDSSFMEDSGVGAGNGIAFLNGSTTVVTGVFSVPGMTATGAVTATFNASPVGGGGEVYVMSHVVPGVNIITVMVVDVAAVAPAYVAMPVATPISVIVTKYS